MGNIRLLETDVGVNANLVSATGTASYTSDGARAIFCDASLYGVAGNGDYVMYVTRQISGSSAASVILPKTTMTAASGETNIGGQSGFVTVGNGDTVLVYIDGLAGDTSVSGTTVRWWEFYALTPLTADRQLNVAADGDIGGNVDGTVNAVVNGYVTVTGTVVASSVSGYVQVTGTVNANMIQISGDATAADNLETATDGGAYNIGGGAVVAASVSADVGITQAGADKVWGSAARTLTSFGTLVADIVTAVFVEAVEGAVTFRQWTRRVSAILFGKASGGGAAGSKKFRDLGDAVNRVDATTDANGNRTSVTFDDS